jgi:hypothetical protein
MYEFEAQIRGENTKIEYNNVIEWLLMAGFKLENPDGLDLLRIIHDQGDHNVRIELTGIGAIQHYCRTNQLINPVFWKKYRLLREQIPDYWTTLTLSKEMITESTELTFKKTFRLMNRVRLTSPDHPFVYDCSIVRTSPTLESLFTTHPSYEIEIEFSNPVTLNHIQKAITLALRGFQRSNYPISLKEMSTVLDDYKKATTTTQFIGPRSVTLQEENMSGPDGIFNDFCVTEKADGERKMLFVSRDRIYFIISKGDTCMVEFTGVGIADLNGTLLDGEHVTKNKKGERINSYIAFDAYFHRKKAKLVDIREYPLNYTNELEKKEYDTLQKKERSEPEKIRFEELKKIKDRSRNRILKKIIETIADVKGIIFSKKEFKHCTEKSCKEILDRTKSDGYEYHTDGLIFTPNSYGVGLTRTHTTIQNSTITWDLSFKWKPAEENTIDFLIEFKDEDLYRPGETFPYKKLHLYVGFGNRDVEANPSYSICQGYEVHPPKHGNVLFKPSDPMIANSHICHVTTKEGKIYTEQREIMESGMIVEFRYDMLDTKWIPMRVRWDKMKNRNPNAFTTASSNWYTIHNPITEDMLSKRDEKTQYYTEKDDTEERSALRIFHNAVKRDLLTVVKAKDTVIDFAIGPGGDLGKLTNASFILGIDVDENNIMNKKYGVCKRYLDAWKKRKDQKTRGLFVQGDSSLPIKSGEGIMRGYDKALVRSVFGLDPKQSIGRGVTDHYAKGANGFNVSSIQFAVHYMFNTITSLTQFLQNVAECTAMNGYFVGTCYDGQKVFNLLKEHPILDIHHDGKSLCKITKVYKQDQVYMNDTCLGYTINVLQSVIGNDHNEWLVFFPYFVSMMEMYGFKEVKIEGFEDVYKRTPPSKAMSEGEKQLSFLNKTFMFQKVKEIFAPVKLEMITIN